MLPVLLSVAQLIGSGYAGPQFNAPALPQSQPVSVRPAVTGLTILVPNGDDPQPYVDQAVAGDQVVLQVGPLNFPAFYLPTTTAGWISVVSSQLDALPEPGTRITSADLPNMATVCSNDEGPAITNATTGMCNYWWLEGIHTSPCAGYDDIQYQQLFLGPGVGYTPQTPPEDVLLPHDFGFEHDWFQGGVNQDGQQIGVYLEADSVYIGDSICSDIQSTYYDSTCIFVDLSHGNHLIQNNSIAGLSEGILYAAAVGPAIPEDVTIQGNYVWKQPNWTAAGSKWTDLKDDIELKNCQRCLVRQNVATTGDVTGAQVGVAFEVTPRAATNEGNGLSTDCQYQQYTSASDITFASNIGENIGQGFEIAGQDNFCPGVQFGARVLLWNNLIFDVNAPTANSSDWAVQLDTTVDLTAIGNTFIDSNPANNTIFVDSGPLTRTVLYRNVLRADVAGQCNGGPVALIGVPPACSSVVPANVPGAIMNNGGYGSFWNASEVAYWGSQGATGTVYDSSANPFLPNYLIRRTSPLRGLGFDPLLVDYQAIINGTPSGK